MNNSISYPYQLILDMEYLNFILSGYTKSKLELSESKFIISIFLMSGYNSCNLLLKNNCLSVFPLQIKVH